MARSSYCRSTILFGGTEEGELACGNDESQEALTSIIRADMAANVLAQRQQQPAAAGP